jgi:hypothetical protein
LFTVYARNACHEVTQLKDQGGFYFFQHVIGINTI